MMANKGSGQLGNQTPAFDKSGFSFSLIGLKGLLEVTLTAIKNAPAWQQTVIYGLFALSLLSLIFLVITLIKGQYLYAIISLSIFAVSLIVAMILGFMAFGLYLKHSHPLGQGSGPSVPGLPAVSNLVRPSWSRVVPKIPIRLDKLEELNTILSEIRDAAVGKIRELRSGRENLIDKQHVRSNVFLARTDTVEEYGEVCGLFIPKHLHVGMQDTAERSIVFRPNEGLTGRVFTLGKVFGAKADPSDGRLDWTPVPLLDEGGDLDEEKFLLREAHEHLIHPHLRWIVSFPLKAEIGGPEKTMGVLNVDGLEHPLEEREMRELARYLTNMVDRFAKRAVELPKVKIAIFVEDVQDV
jgi:hypothetical protein